MISKVAVIEIEGDECLPAEGIAALINEALAAEGTDADDVLGVMQPSGYSVTRVFFRKRER